MDRFRAFAPGHVTGFFAIHPHDDPRHHGSTGAGFCLSEGTTTELSPAADDLVLLNGLALDGAPVSQTVLRLFREATGSRGRWQVAHRTSLPVGCGFGTSGSGALSLALALNQAAGFPLSAQDAAVLAHRAELVCGTGLGTVLGEVNGGFELRLSPGAPGTGLVRSLPYEDGLTAVFLVFGPIATSARLADAATALAVSREGEALRDELARDPGFARFLELSYGFGRRAGLVGPRLRGLQDQLGAQGLTAPMLMFGDGLFTLTPASAADEVRARFAAVAAGGQVFLTGLDPQGGRILGQD